MADEDATLRHSNSVHSDIDLRQMASNLSQNLSSHEKTERSISHDREQLDPDIHKRLWTPFFLRRYTLLSFIAFYLFIAASLVVLLVIDRAQQGLASARTSQHYLWTYGPTAILTLAATFWGQVEYRAKQVMPWGVLRTGPTKASETLFIDYVSINQINALIRSFKARHFPVTVVVMGSMLIKLLVVISTSLLVLEEHPRAIENVPVFSTEVYNTTYWESETDGYITPVLYTIAMSLYNISYRAGTLKEQAVPSLDFQPLNLRNHDTIEVDLPTFQTDISCETARLTSMTVRDKSLGIEFETSSSTFQYLFLDLYKEWMGASADFHLMKEQYLGENRYGIFSGYMRPHTSNFRPYTAEPSRNSDTNESSIMTILVCQPKYKITPFSVKMDSDQMLLSNPSSTHLSNSREQLADLSDDDFFLKLNIAVGTMDIWRPILELGGVGMEDVYSDRKTGDDIDSTLFTLLILGRVHHIESLLDPNVLEDAYRNLFKSASAQLAKARLLSSGSELYKATIHTTQQRIHVRNVSVYCALGLLAALIITTAILCILAPHNIASRDIDSIGGFSTILSRSFDLSTYLSGAGCAHLARMRDAMSSKWCKSHARHVNGNPHFGIDFYGEDNLGESLQGQKGSSDNIQWWRPFAVSAVHKALVLFSVTTIIVALEVLHHQSQINSGLVKISNQGIVRYAWLYVPVLVMMAIQLLVAMISSTSNLILPYHELRLWPSDGERALLSKQSSLLTVHALYNSINHRHWAITATSVSMLLSPFLTIAAAGLYTAETVPSAENVPLRIQDTLLSAETREYWLNYETNVSSASNAVFISSVLMHYEDMVYPAWTLPGLVFPKIESLERENSSNPKDSPTFFEDQSSVTVRLTALRPSLNCSILADDELNITIHSMKIEMETVQDIDITVKYPDGCIVDDKGYNDGLQPWSIFYDEPKLGKARDIQSTTGLPSCPSLMMAYGWNNDTPSIHVAMCDGFVEEVQVDTTFSLPSFDILDAQIDENTARRVENGSASLGHLLHVADVSEQTFEMATGFYGFDSFFSAIVRRLETQSLHWNDILGKEGLPQLVEVIQDYWRTVFPQYLNLRSRTRIQGENSAVNGTIIRPNQYRLQQSEISTRILEVLLGLIGVCVGISFWAMNTKEILPKNPCSIAAQASLLAGSSMLREEVIPPGSEWCNDKELRKMRVFDGFLFSMGWRGGADGERRWFGIDVGRSDWSR